MGIMTIVYTTVCICEELVFVVGGEEVAAILPRPTRLALTEALVTAAMC
jgi:hypothetical protein